MVDNTPSVLTSLMSSGWTRYRKTLRRAKALMTDEAVHDLRVTLRRLETSVDLVRLFLPDSQTQGTARALKDFRKSLGALRDVQVQVLLLSDLTNVYPDLLKFQRSLGKRERELTQKVKKIIRKKHPQLEKEFSETVARSRDFLRMFTRVETERTIVGGIDRAFERVIKRKQAVDQRDTSAIHRLRVAFKKFRYAIETAEPVLHDLPQDLPQRMRQIQGMMGEIQDAEMLFETLNRWGRKRKKATQRRLDSVYRALAQKRRDHIDSFLANIDQIRTLWQLQAHKTKSILPAPLSVAKAR